MTRGSDSGRSRDRNSDRNRARNKDQQKGRSAAARLIVAVLAILLVAAFLLLPDKERIPDDKGRTAGTADRAVEIDSGGVTEIGTGSVDDASQLPQWNGSNYVEIDGGVPSFPQELYDAAGLAGSGRADADPVPFEYYGQLDDLGRCTAAWGCLGEETMPARGEQRGDISDIHPSGWTYGQNWERSHLIAWALGAENANDRNLVTGTHYFNYDGMRPLEEEVEHYIWNTGNHVLYMVRPVFAGDELVPRGAQMAAWSVEDGGQGVSFNVYCFNVTPGAEIDYCTGIVTTQQQASQGARDYVLNTRSGVFHLPSCEGAGLMSEHNRREVHATRSEMIAEGYTPCGECRP